MGRSISRLRVRSNFDGARFLAILFTSVAGSDRASPSHSKAPLLTPREVELPTSLPVEGVECAGSSSNSALALSCRSGFLARRRRSQFRSSRFRGVGGFVRHVFAASVGSFVTFSPASVGSFVTISRSAVGSFVTFSSAIGGFVRHDFARPSVGSFVTFSRSTVGSFVSSGVALDSSVSPAADNGPLTHRTTDNPPVPGPGGA